MNSVIIRSGYTALESIVYLFLDMSDRGEDAYRKAYNLAIWVYREMMMDVTGEVDTAIINVLANKTGKLPSNYSNYRRVGIPNSDGELADFTRNDDLSSLNVLDPNRQTNSGVNTYDGGTILTQDNIARDVFFPFQSIESVGIGSVNNIGNFKIDKLNGYIIFDPNFAYTQVIMEFLPDANKPIDGDYFIDSNASPAILAGIIWQWNRLRKDVSRGEKSDNRAEYYNQKRLARKRMNPITLQDLNDSGRRGVKASPKA